ncbi:hypothetical protein PH586_19840 [Pseudomonas sp. SA3-5]|uniref:Uncharacterized protein n=1 Tax=Pseudomonas aestuarii TaxID=3018340 RepID=A0ABT4XK85_9PSED|nr:hypothetical protein [Pseudomonas aestuarii]MDA7088636.1 hypothetical protein [Pseudomonas aestuarii]
MKKALVVLVFFFVAVAAFWGYGNYVRLTGSEGASWLLDMWGVRYFGLRSESNQDFEFIYHRSLGAGASKDQGLIDYVVGNKCYDSSWRCSVIMTAASNLMLDDGQVKVGLRGAVEAYERTRGGCSIILETTILSYHLRELSSVRSINVESRAGALLRKIKARGGVLSDIRGDACRELVSKSPEYFTTYALLIAKLLVFSGGRNAYSAAYIDSLER